VFDAGKQLSDSRGLARCLEAWSGGRFEIAINHAILPENEWVVARFAVHYSEKAPADRHGAIRVAGHLFVPSPCQVSTADPKNEMFIKGAVAAGADRIVTGDRGHFLSPKEAAASRSCPPPSPSGF